MHEMNYYYYELFWWNFGFDIICYVKVSCDFLQLRLVSGCQFCFRPLCVYWREIKNLKNLDGERFTVCVWSVVCIIPILGLCEIFHMRLAQWHWICGMSAIFDKKIDKVHWIFPHGLNCLKMMYV